MSKNNNGSPSSPTTTVDSLDSGVSFTIPFNSQIVEDALKAKRIKVFIPDDDLVWIAADIISEVKVGHYEIEFKDADYKGLPRRIITMKSLCRKIDSLPLQNNLGESGVNDMCSLNYLHEASILDNLRRRFESRLPYTDTGEISIAVNPYQVTNLDVIILGFSAIKI